jgi:hypothetical protein
MTGIPPGARLEADLGHGVALYDVSHLLQRTPREQHRDPADIVRVYHHHSGALGRDGYQGLAASVRYVVMMRKPPFPGPAYTYWLSYSPDLDGEQRMAVYRAQPDDIVSWHTGLAANRHGVAICWQGNLSKARPTAAQRRMSERLCLWLEDRHPGLEHSYHAEAGRYGGRTKATCPGPHVRTWVDSWRSQERAVEFGTRSAREVS